MTSLLEDILAQPLIEDRLAPVPPPGTQRLTPPEVLPPDPRDLPVVTIGTPYVERVSPVPESVAVAERTKLNESLLFLVVMACSFRPIQSKVTVGWARFLALLLPDERGHVPKALDLYPDRVEESVPVTTKLGLSPTLSFASIKLSIGEFSRLREYPKVEPKISSAGRYSPKATWDFNVVAEHPIHGDKLLCALVAAPRELSELRLALAASADLKYRGLTLPSWLGGRSDDGKPAPVEATVWKARA